MEKQGKKAGVFTDHVGGRMRDAGGRGGGGLI